MGKPRVELPWARAAPCPCGSGLSLSRCCAGGVDGCLRAKPFNLERVADETGFDREGCYLAGGKNCGKKLTLEHPISHNLLRQMPNLALRGFPGTDGSIDVVIPSKSAGYKVLCDLHNSDLAIIDEHAGRVFADIKEAVFPIRQPDNNNRESWVYIDGPRLEAFACKAIAAHQAQGNFTAEGKPVKFTVDWTKLRAAIMRGAFEADGGMFVCESWAPNEADGCQYRPLSNIDNHLVGAHLCMRGFSFAVIFDAERFHEGIIPINRTYRPSVHQLYGVGGSAFIVLGWRHRYNGRRFSRGRVTTTPTGSNSNFPFVPLPGPPEQDVRGKINAVTIGEGPSAFAPIDVGPFDADPAPWGR